MKRKIKQVLSLVMAIAIVFGSMPLSIFAQSSEIEIPLTEEKTDVPKVLITADATNVSRGEEVRFAISASDVEPVRAYGALFSYDETVFELISAEILFDGAFISDVDINEGVVVALWQKQIDINGDIISFVLKVKDDASLGEHEISAEVSLREDGDCNLNVNTVINVFEQEPTAKPTAQPTVEPTTEPTAQPTSAPTATPTTKPTAEPKVTIAADRKSVSRGEKVRFVISASDVEPVTAYGTLFSYDETVFELISAEILFDEAFFSDVDIKEGVVVAVWQKPIDINGDIISFVLKVKDDASLGEYEISATESFRGDSDCDLNVNAVINVSEQEPTAQPTAQPTVEPTTEPTAQPTSAPTATPTTQPTSTPTAQPTTQPTSAPTATPTAKPTAEPKVTIAADRKSVSRGEKVRFVISASDVEPVRAYGALFSYDKTVFELISAQILFDEAFTSDVDISEGVVTAVWLSPIDINGDIISFVLKVNENAPLGEHEIGAEVAFRGDSDCNLNVNTVINVFGQEPTAQPTTEPTAEPTETPSKEPVLITNVDQITEGHVKLNNDITGAVDLSKGTYVIDLAGKKWSTEHQYIKISGSANVTIKDSVGGGMISVRYNDAIHAYGGSLTLDGVIVSADGSGLDAIFVQAGNILVKNSTLIAPKAGIDAGQSDTAATIVVDGGTFGVYAGAEDKTRSCAIELRNDNKNITLKGDIKFENNVIIRRNDCTKELEQLITFGEESKDSSFTDTDITFSNGSNTWRFSTIDYKYTPSSVPTAKPTVEPTTEPTATPTTEPTATPTTKPTAEPTAQPTDTPSKEPVLITNVNQITEGYVKLNNDITGTIDLSKGTYVIDLAGKKWTITDYRSLGISGSANVTIKDSVGGGMIFTENNDAVVINTTGIVILDGVTIEADGDGMDAIFVNGGNVTVKNCILKASRASLSNYNANNTTIKVIGCELDGDTHALIVKNNGVITIGAGTKFNNTTVEMRAFDSTRTFADSFIATDDYIIKFGENVWTERGFLLTEVTRFELCSHKYGAWEKHNETQHKKTCECGKAQYADHIWNEGEITKPSTHTTVGEKTYTCKDCAEIKSEEIAKTPEHEHGKWEKHNETQHKKTCACGDVQYADHAWNDGVVTTPSTHTTVGEKTYTCTVCGEIKTEEIAKTPEHEHGAWEKYNETQHKKTCACGDIQYADHAWNDGVVTTPSTHTTVGEKTYTCTVCGEIKTEEIAKTPEHEHGAWEKYNETQHKKTCACGDIRYANHKWDDGVETTPATHTTVGEKTYTCTECGETKSEEIAKTPEHEHGKWEKHNETQHKKTCACGDIRYANHKWDDGVETTPATHTTVGEKTYTCTECGETKSEEIAKTPEHEHGKWEKHNETQHKKTCACGDVQYADHEWDDGVETTPATHTTVGEKTYTCTECGETKSEEIAKTPEHEHGKWEKHNETQHKKTCACGDAQYADHEWDDGVETTPATHTTVGEKTYTCTECGETKSEEIAKTPEHEHGKWEKHNETQHKKTCACGDVQYADHEWIENEKQCICEKCDAVLEIILPSEESNVVVDTEKETVSGITAQSKPADVIAQFKGSDNIQIVGKDGKLLADDAFVGTGCKVQLVKSGEVKDEVTIVIKGEIDGNGKIDSDDAIYLLRNTLFASLYPVVADDDVDGNGEYNSDDAIHLLRHTLFPSLYPLK